MKQWIKYLFATYFQSLGAALFFAAILGSIFTLDAIVIFFLTAAGSLCIFVTKVIVEVEDGKLDAIIWGENV